jgi:chromosome segregation ATPase
MKSNKTTKQIRATAKQAVAEVLAAEEPKQKEKMEELVEGYQTELSEIDEAKAAVEEENKTLSADNEALRSEKKELEDRISELETEISELKKAKEAIEQAKKDLETKLGNMEQDAAMQKRVNELEEAGLLTSGTVTDKLKTRIKKMDEEEFAEYKTELITFKSEWEKKTTPSQAVVANADADANADVDADVDADADGTDDDLDSSRVTAAQLLKLKKQIMASINVASGGEPDVPEEMKKDYASMWDEEKEEK